MNLIFGEGKNRGARTGHEDAQGSALKQLRFDLLELGMGRKDSPFEVVIEEMGEGLGLGVNQITEESTELFGHHIGRQGPVTAIGPGR